jgi:gliding-associated putative ABC transporter substrate-binding component GldG
MNIKKHANTLLIVVLVILVNLIFSSLNIRLDITKEKIYSLSQGTKRILKKIDDNLFIDVYYSKELPPQITTIKDYTITILNDYKDFSANKIKLSLFKIDDDQKSKKLAIEEGITPVRFDIISKEKFEQREGFLGITMRYHDKKETIPFISDISNLEYDISSRINNLVRKTKKTIYFINDWGSLSSYRLNPEIREKIRSNYEIRDISVEEIYKDTSAINLCIIGPNSPIDEKNLFYLDQIFVRGANIFLALDKKYTSMESFFARDNNTNLEKILEKNGIKILNTLIMDRNSQAIQIGFRQGPFVITNIVKYPFFIITTDIDRKNPTTKDLSSLTIPFASPIEYSTTSLIITPLVKTSRYSFAKKENSYISINPFQDYVVENDDLKGPFTVSLTAKGKFISSFNEPPKDKELKDKKIQFIKEGSRETLLYLVSSSKFIYNQDLNPDNIQYLINIINYIAQDEDLMMIKSKKAGIIPLREINETYKVIIKYINILLPVFIIIAFGIYRWKKLKIEKETAIKEFVK